MLISMKKDKKLAADKNKERELSVLTRFVEVYCQGNHERHNSELCPECADLLAYGKKRLEKCPYDPKPKCKDCKTHCYSPAYSQRIKEVMRYSGMHFVKRGRIDWLVKYFA
jgi:hypothetical protein